MLVLVGNERLIEWNRSALITNIKNGNKRVILNLIGLWKERIFCNYFI